MSIHDTDASPASETEVLTQAASAATDGATQDANTAQSSGADETDAKQEAPKDLSDVVRRVVEKPEEQKEEPSTSEAKTEKAEEPEAQAEGDDAESDVPFHKHPRWQEMKAERDSFKQDAEQYRSITDFMQQTNLSGQEVAEGFEIMALLKSGDPANLSKARDWFDVRLKVLNETLGHNLPDDLREKVESGMIDEEMAKDYAKERAKARNLENLRTVDEQRSTQERQIAEARALQSSMATAVQQWEDGIKAKDPDYAAKKAKLVETQVRALIQERGAPPSNPDEALQLVQSAYGAVEDMLKPLLPKPKPMTPTPSGMSARATTAPNTLGAAIRAALNH